MNKKISMWHASYLFIRRIFIVLALLLIYSCDEVNLHQSPDLESVHLKQSKVYFRSGQYSASLSEAKKALQQNDQSLEAISLITESQIAVGNFKEALESLQLSSQPLDSNRPLANLYLEALLMQGHGSRVIRFIEKNDSLWNQFKPQQQILLARAHENLGNFGKAVDIYQTTYAEHEKTSIFTLIGLARNLLIINRNEEALNVITAALTQLPNDPEVLAVAGEIARANGDLSQADAYYSKALVYLPDTDILTPRKARILNQFSELLVLSGRTTEATVYSLLVSESYPDFATIEKKIILSEDLIANEKREEAAIILSDLVTEAADSNNANKMLTQLLAQRGAIAKASNLYPSI